MKLPPLLLLPLTLLLPFLTPTTTTSMEDLCIPNIDYYETTAPASNGISDMGFELLRKLQGRGNTLLSPYSVWNVLVKVLAGTEVGAQSELLPVLGLKHEKGALALLRRLDERLRAIAKYDRNFALVLSNDMYVSEGLSLKKCRKEFVSICIAICFKQSVKASDYINSHIEKASRGLIPRVLEPSLLRPDTEMVLVNAIYFKGKWTNQFPKRNTVRKPFYPMSNSNPVEVDMMFGTLPVKYGVSDELHAVVLELPYSKGEVSMSILLPQGRGVYGFVNTLHALTSDSFWNAIHSLRETYVDVHLPRFEIVTDYDDEMKAALKIMGLIKVFDPHRSYGNDNLYVDHIIHRAYLAVNEDGTDGGGYSESSVKEKFRANYMVVNRPFIFVLHTHETILFVGDYKEP